MIILLRRQYIQFVQTLRLPICPHLFRLITNGNTSLATSICPSMYPSKYLLLKMPYRFNTSYQLLVRSNEYLLCDWFLSLDLRRSRP